jgi:hypothetical protein
MTLSFFWALKTHFRIGRHENKEKRLFYFGLRILLPIQIQLLETENPKNPKGWVGCWNNVWISFSLTTRCVELI